jgi:hypothetical protein
MASYDLSVIPNAPQFVPEPVRQQEGVRLFRSMVTRDGPVEARIHEHVQFIVPMGNLERVSCPNCGADLKDWWGDALGRACAGQFADLSVVTPCCQHHTTLNDLRWELPAGFARFEMEAENRGDYLQPGQLSQLERVIGCPLRQVLRRV